MSPPPGPGLEPAGEVKWDVASPELHGELITSPPPLGLRVTATSHGFHRDIYYDTADASLARRDVTCRFRVGSDDRRVLTVAFASRRQRFSSPVAELDLAAALRGESEAARRLRGLVDPATLERLAELEVERTIRVAAGRWPWSARYELVYDNVTVRHGRLSREFREMKARRVRGGRPDLAELAAAMRSVPGTRPILESKLGRAQRMIATLEGEALARSLGTGRAVTLLAMDGGAVAFQRKGDTLTLPIADGQGEDASRHLLRATFGSAVGDLALLGTASGRGAAGRLQEVWLARRLRLDGEQADAVEWLDASEVAARAGSAGFQDPDTLAALAVAIRSNVLRQTDPGVRVQRSRPTAPPPVPASEAQLFLDADLSTLEFQGRVMALAEDPTTPLLERLNFLAIVSSNLDEFYMVNVGALKEKADEEDEARLEAIAIRVAALQERQHRVLEACLAALGAAGIRLRKWEELSGTGRALLEAQFQREIFPLVTPRAITVSPGFPVPVMPHLNLLLGVVLQDAQTGPAHFAYLRLPERIPRFLPVPDSNDLILLEDVVRSNLHHVYPDRRIEGAWLFRLTRAAELDLSDEDAGNLLQAIEESVSRRAVNPIVRVEVERTMPQPLRERLVWELRFERGADAGSVRERDLVPVDGMLDLRALRELMGAPVPGGRFPPFEGRDPWPGERDLWSMLRRGDALVHHPYDRFADSTARLFSDAADDPAVVAIRLTLYRVGERSPIVDALTRALERKKEVSIFVELKARFDETRNVGWVRRLEEAGATVVYGVVGLKNHAKVGLVLRREEDGLRHYVHIGTGNYNAATAKVYTDLSLFSADPDLGADLQDLFNQLTGSSRAPAGSFRRIAVAPEGLLPWLLESIEREREHAAAGRPARIRAKLNGIADTEVVQALYRASRAGVPIDLVVRGLCVLRPGVTGHSERIRVVSRLGRFLEHARIYHFGNGGRDDYYIGSADWRPRNLRRRVEVVAPVRDSGARAMLDEILTSELADPEAWILRPDGSYFRARDDQA
ncbi:MAG TPA: polyphosphate kinase 1 [Gemmatimonadales bacterium]|nr:polyphosphate kinase 1 [Gemmatimonadales bacterium]